MSDEAASRRAFTEQKTMLARIAELQADASDLILNREAALQDLEDSRRYGEDQFRTREQAEAALAERERMHGEFRMHVGAWLRGEMTEVCGDCGHGSPSCDMEFGRYCTQGDESKVWDVAPWGECHFTPSRWSARAEEGSDT